MPFSFVITALVAVIHCGACAICECASKFAAAWIAGTSPAMTRNVDAVITSFSDCALKSDTGLRVYSPKTFPRAREF
jgi:hypothetical protein